MHSQLRLGGIGIDLPVVDNAHYAADAATLEDVGYSAIWLAGGQLRTLQPLTAVLNATRSVPVGSGIIPIGVYSPDDVRQLYAATDDRLIVGLGGARGRHALADMNHFLDELDPAIPPARRILAGMGPRMLTLARERAAGAIPLLITPDYTKLARSILGPDSTLIVSLFVVLESVPETARNIAREPLRFLSGVGGYPASFRRMGFTEADVATLSDHLVDELVAWGDPARIAERIAEHRDAGADQVTLSVLTDAGHDGLQVRRDLAAHLPRVLAS